MTKGLNRRRCILIGLLLALATLAAFWQVRNYGLVNYDDDRYVSANPHVKAGLTRQGLTWALTTGYASNWHPLTWLSLMADVQLFGPNAGGYHLTSLVLHVIAALLLLAVLAQMTGAVWKSAFVAGLFALHPLHVESVVWISERKDVLSALFWMLTLTAYVYYVRHPGKMRYLLTLVLFALGLMAKPMLITLPFVLLLLDYWPLERYSFGPTVQDIKKKRQKSINPRAKLSRLILEKIPFLLLSALSSLVTFVVQQKGGAVAPMELFPLPLRLMNAVNSYGKYIEKMIFPDRLAVFYPPPVQGFSAWRILALALALVAVSLAVIYFARKIKFLGTGWFWYLGTLVPVIGLVQVGSQSLADRYTYLTLIGLFILIAWGLPELLAKWKYQKVVLGAAGIAVILVLSVGTYGQVRYWRDDVALFEHAVKVTKNNFLMNCHLGSAYEKAGRPEEAIRAYERAIKINPNYAPAYYGLGLVYSHLGRWQDAVKANEQAIKIKPDDAAAYNSLGGAHLRLGRLKEAEEAFQQTVRIQPDFVGAYNNLGVIYRALGRWPEAISVYRQAVGIQPDYADAYYGLGVAYGNLGRWPEAIEAFKQAIKNKPDDAEARFNLGLAFLQNGDKDSALEEYKRLLSSDAEKANQLFDRIQKK